MSRLTSGVYMYVWAQVTVKILHSHCGHATDMQIKFHQNHTSQALLKCMHVHCPSILTKFSMCSASRRVM